MRFFLKPKNDAPWHETFKYEPSTGYLINRFNRGNAHRAGEIAGSLSAWDGYVKVKLLGRRFQAHRVIWEMVNGQIQDGMEIDHINGLRADNRLSNLRLVTRSGNQRNKSLQRNNTSGYMGVYLNKKSGRYIAQIGINGLSTYIGSFNTAEQAHQAHMMASRDLGYHENHGRTH